MAGKREQKRLRRGFSTGTAMVAAACGAYRVLVTGGKVPAIAVRLPSGIYYGVALHTCVRAGADASASVIKRAGDDPDVTNGAEIRVRLGYEERMGPPADGEGYGSFEVRLIRGEGVGVVTKRGLPVEIGEPAVNPVPRRMLVENLRYQFLRWGLPERSHNGRFPAGDGGEVAAVSLPLPSFPDGSHRRGVIHVEVSITKGEQLARHTLNPRLGIVGGLSILGTTGIVKPFSHKAYEETIQSALGVARANGCRTVVLSTGGKSEKAAQRLLPELPEEAFVQVADFFSFAVEASAAMGFERIVHSVFFGKVVKMAQGHRYTHAHTVPLDLNPLADEVLRRGYSKTLVDRVRASNTAREALEWLLQAGAGDVIRAVAKQAVEQSKRRAAPIEDVRLLLFGFNTALLVDVSAEQ